jgi:ADP-heptose:LPS heptosyltransferase
VDAVRHDGVSEAVVLTSFHQSALPLALLLRQAGVGRITAVSESFPGSLLDVRVPDPGDVPEAERALTTVAAAGFPSPPGDAGRLAVRRPLPDVRGLVGAPGYVVLHPGTSVPARAWPATHWAVLCDRLRREGTRVVVTGSARETELTAEVARDGALDLGGSCTFAELAAVLDGARAVVVANTGPAHLAAAVGTPVVSLFAPTVPAARWAPYGVGTQLLGDQQAACAGSRARVCPVPGHPCLGTVSPTDVLAALDALEVSAA